MRRIGIITYNYRHLKTQQVVERLYRDRSSELQICLFALPFVPRAERQVIFPHRPTQFSGSLMSELAQTLDLEYRICSSDIDFENDCEIYLLTGAGILSSKVIAEKRIVNCHAGIIPMVRGLDALKWAIIEKMPIGNTLHYINEEVDVGSIIAVKQTPLYLDDTLEMFAQRHYEAEVNMLADFYYYIKNPENSFQLCSKGPVHKRMPLETEKLLEECFKDYKSNFAMNVGYKDV